MSGMSDDAEARLLQEVLGDDWDLALPEPVALDFLQHQEPCEIPPFPEDFLVPTEMENLEGFGNEADLSWILFGSPKDATTECPPNTNNDQDWKLDGDSPYNWNELAALSDPKSPSSTRTSNSSCQTTVNEKAKKTKKKPVPASTCPDQGPLDDDAERKRKARQERNRENAHNSRQRKKMYLVELEKKCRTLESENYQLKLENASLKYQIAGLYQTLPMPGQQPMAVIPPQPPHGSIPCCAPVFDCGKLDHPPKLPIWPETNMPNAGGDEDRTQSGLQQVCTTPICDKMGMEQLSQGVAPNGGLSESGRSTTGQKQGTKRGAVKRSEAHLKNMSLDLDVASDGIDLPTPGGKKQKLASIATSVALLCMCAIAMNFGGNQLATPSELYREPGRHLQALPGPIDADDVAVTGDVQLRSPEMTDTEMKGCPRTDDYSQNPPPKYTVNFPPFEAIESSALDKLRELGPLAVLLSEADTQMMNRRLLPDAKEWTNFTELVSGVFSSSGFIFPGMCKEEFRFDASLVKDVDAARKKLQRHLFALTTYEGHSVDAIPLPPGGNWKEDDGGFSFGEKKMDYGDEKDSGIIVSLFLPIQSHLQQTGILTAIHSIYVVVLKPTATYWTYSCPLSVPVYV